METQQGYAASASERPLSEGVATTGEPPQHAHVNEPPTSAVYGSEKMNGGSTYARPTTNISENLWKTGGETFLLATFVLGLVSILDPSVRADVLKILELLYRLPGSQLLLLLLSLQLQVSCLHMKYLLSLNFLQLR